jgi:hypothetical protein
MQFAASLSSEFAWKQARVCDNAVLEKPSRCPGKHQSPNPKHQRSTHIQAPIRAPRSHLNIRAWTFFGTCCLGFPPWCQMTRVACSDGDPMPKWPRKTIRQRRCVAETARSDACSRWTSASDIGMLPLQSLSGWGIRKAHGTSG